MTRESKTKEKFFPRDYTPRRSRASKGSMSRSNARKSNERIECPECGSWNCKQRVFNIKCYDCGVIIEESPDSGEL